MTSARAAGHKKLRLGVYTDPGHVIAYEDGEVRQEFVVVFTAGAVGEELAVSDESTDVRYVDPAEMDGLPMHESVRLRIHHHLERRDRPYLG
jgi:hypothetical protein